MLCEELLEFKVQLLSGVEHAVDFADGLAHLPVGALHCLHYCIFFFDQIGDTLF